VDRRHHLLRRLAGRSEAAANRSRFVKRLLINGVYADLEKASLQKCENKHAATSEEEAAPGETAVINNPVTETHSDSATL